MPHLPDHQTDHDALLIAAFAAGDAEGADLERAQALVAACDDCAALHHDLRAIAAAMPSVPAPARRRDFRLTPQQAAELRPSGWRRLLAPLAGPRFAFAGPLGGSLAALGLAGILVAGVASTPSRAAGRCGTNARARPPARPPPRPRSSEADGSVAPAEHPQAPGLEPQPVGLPQPSVQAVAPGAGVSGEGGPAASTPPGDTTVDAPPPPGDASAQYANGSSDAGTKNPPDAAGSGKVEPAAPATPAVEASPVASPFLAGAVVLLVVGMLLVAGRLIARRAA